MMQGMKTLNKTTWPKGVWQEEDDLVIDSKAQWPAFLVRDANTGVWKGFAAVPRGHAGFRKRFDLLGHTGMSTSLNWSGELDQAGHIMQIMPEEHERRQWWWFGFDFGHGTDLLPTHASTHKNHYVTQEEAVTNLQKLQDMLIRMRHLAVRDY